MYRNALSKFDFISIFVHESCIKEQLSIIVDVNKKTTDVIFWAILPFCATNLINNSYYMTTIHLIPLVGPMHVSFFLFEYQRSLHSMVTLNCNFNLLVKILLILNTCHISASCDVIAFQTATITHALTLFSITWIPKL